MLWILVRSKLSLIGIPPLQKLQYYSQCAKWSEKQEILLEDDLFL